MEQKAEALGRDFWFSFQQKNRFLFPNIATNDKLSQFRFNRNSGLISKHYNHIITSRTEEEKKDFIEFDDDCLMVLFQFGYVLSSLFHTFMLINDYHEILADIGGIGFGSPQYSTTNKNHYINTVETWSRILEQTDSDSQFFIDLVHEMFNVGRASLWLQVRDVQEVVNARYQKKKANVMLQQLTEKTKAAAAIENRKRKRLHIDGIPPPPPPPPPPAKFYFVFLILKHMLDQFHQTSLSSTSHGWNIPKFSAEWEDEDDASPSKVSDLLFYLVTCVRQMKADLKKRMTDFSGDVYHDIMLYQPPGLSKKFALFYEKRDRLVLNLTSTFTFFRKQSKRLDPKLAQSLKLFIDELQLKDLAEDEYRT